MSQPPQTDPTASTGTTEPPLSAGTTYWRKLSARASLASHRLIG